MRHFRDKQTGVFGLVAVRKEGCNVAVGKVGDGQAKKGAGGGCTGTSSMVAFWRRRAMAVATIYDLGSVAKGCPGGSQVGCVKGRRRRGPCLLFTSRGLVVELCAMWMNKVSVTIVLKLVRWDIEYTGALSAASLR